MSRKNDKKKQKPAKAGGLAFFVSLFMLLLLGGVNILHIPALWEPATSGNGGRFLLGVMLGAWLSYAFLKGHVSVLIHEFKHALISNLVGNKWKGMKVKENSGHFEYAYSKSTAAYNAFISVAPYWLPVFTLPLLGISLALWYGNHQLIVFVVGIGYGADLICNTRDISPIQTDLTEINGGYGVALIYVLAINIVVFSLLIAWVFQGLFGLKYLLFGLWHFLLNIIMNLRA